MIFLARPVHDQQAGLSRAVISGLTWTASGTGRRGLLQLVVIEPLEHVLEEGPQNGEAR
jgi:hypothetical protein